jgi:hypothetical protein
VGLFTQEAAFEQSLRSLFGYYVLQTFPPVGILLLSWCMLFLSNKPHPCKNQLEITTNDITHKE